MVQKHGSNIFSILTYSTGSFLLNRYLRIN
jgi:hypothetical protein